MKPVFLFLALFAFALHARELPRAAVEGQNVALLDNRDSRPTAPVALWPEGAPGALGTRSNDIPTLTAYFPKTNETGAAMIICPGGGYGGLANYEGEDYALWLNTQGIAGFVLKYRLGSAGYRHPRMLEDASRAIRLLRAKAGGWKLDAKRIGICGSSAGGHLASTLLTHFDMGNDSADPIERESSRPDLGILCYPVITMGEKTHSGSKANLLGKNPSPELILELSNEFHVTKETAPCFIWHTFDDKGVLMENSLLFAAALRKANVPFELHIYEHGAHGLALGSKEYDPHKWHRWTSDCSAWLKEQHFGR
jgi:acetyl esterase/lipase